MSALLFNQLAAGGVPCTAGAVARGFSPTSIIHITMLFLATLSFAVMMALEPAHRGTAAIHHRIMAAVVEVLLATKRDLPEITVQRAALQALCLLADPEIAPLVPAHVRPACVHWYSRLSEHLERGVGMLQAGDIALVLEKLEPIVLQVSTTPLPAHLTVEHFTVAVIGAPKLSAHHVYATFTRPGWHSSGLPLVEEPQAALAYLASESHRRQSAVLIEKALNYADCALQEGLELKYRPLLERRSAADAGLKQAALEATKDVGRESVPFTTMPAEALGQLLEEVGGWIATIFTGQAFHNQPVVGGPPAAAAASFALDTLLVMMRTAAGQGLDEKLGIEVRLATSTTLREMAAGLVYLVLEGLKAAPPDSRDDSWLLVMISWMLSAKIVELQSQDLLQCACPADELALRLQRVEGMVARSQQAVQAAVSGFLAGGCPPQELLIMQLAGLARSSAEFQQQCDILQLLAIPDPLTSLDDLPAAAAAPYMPEAAHCPAVAPPVDYAVAVAAFPAAVAPPMDNAVAVAAFPAVNAAPMDDAVAVVAGPALPEPPARPAAQLPEQQQAGPGIGEDEPPALPPASEQELFVAAAQLATTPAPPAELKLQPELPAPAPALPIGPAAPLPSPSPAISSGAVAVAAAQEATDGGQQEATDGGQQEATDGGQQEVEAATAAAEEQQPGDAAGAADVEQRDDVAVPARVLALLQPQHPMPASRGQTAPGAAGAPPRLRKVADVVRFMHSMPERARQPQIMERLQARAPDELAHRALFTIEEEEPMLSAQRLFPQAGQQLPEQIGGSGSGGSGGSGAGATQTGTRSGGGLQAFLAEFTRKLQIGKRKPTGATEVQAAAPLATVLRLTGFRRSAAQEASPAPPKSRRTTDENEAATSAIPFMSAPTGMLPTRRKLELFDKAVNGPIVKPPQLLVRLVERRSRECELMESMLLMDHSDLRIGQKQIQLDLYHGHKAARRAICTLLQSNDVELQRFATSQGVSAAALELLKQHIGDYLEIDLACLAPAAPPAVQDAMPTALNCCASAGNSPPQEPARMPTASGINGGSVGGSGSSGGGSSGGIVSGPRLAYCSVSKIAMQTDAQIVASRAAMLSWIAENSGRMAVVHEGGGVNVSFRLNRLNPEVCSANGSWHTVAVTLPAKI